MVDGRWSVCGNLEMGGRGRGDSKLDDGALLPPVRVACKWLRDAPGEKAEVPLPLPC